MLRTLVIIFITLVVSACAQTRPANELSKYDKSVEFAEVIFTDSFIEEALLSSFLEYKQENENADVKLSDEALRQIMDLLTKNTVKNKAKLITKVAKVLTDEFTDDEIVALHSIKDLQLLKSASEKLSQRKAGKTNVPPLTDEEITALNQIENIGSFETALPKLEGLKGKMEAVGNEFANEMLLEILPELIQILQKNEPLIGADFHLPHQPISRQGGFLAT